MEKIEPASGPLRTKMKHEEKNGVVRETARTPSAEKITLHSDDPKYTEKAVSRIGDTLEKIRSENGWSNARLMQHLDTRFYSGADTLSRIINHDNKRMPNAAQVFELRRVFGADLNALADGDEPFAIEQMSDECLVDLLELVTAELVSRRREKWQK